MLGINGHLNFISERGTHQAESYGRIANRATSRQDQKGCGR
jgi:hypothetical protein